MNFMLKKADIPLTIAFFVLMGLLLTLLAPSEKVLGAIVKLVYLHGTFILIGLLMFTISGVVGFAHIITNRNPIFPLVKATEHTAIIFWVCGTFIGILTAYLAWGGILLFEPRLIVAVLISLLSLGAYMISTSIKKPTITSLLSILIAVSALGLMLNVGRVLHPVNPIRGSGPSIELYFYSITLIFLIVAIQMIRWMNREK